jgi:hypothetical protein
MPGPDRYPPALPRFRCCTPALGPTITAERAARFQCRSLLPPCCRPATKRQAPGPCCPRLPEPAIPSSGPILGEGHSGPGTTRGWLLLLDGPSSPTAEQVLLAVPWLSSCAQGGLRSSSGGNFLWQAARDVPPLPILTSPDAEQPRSDKLLQRSAQPGAQFPGELRQWRCQLRAQLAIWQLGTAPGVDSVLRKKPGYPYVCPWPLRLLRKSLKPGD